MRVAILLATYNGARFLDEQLASIAEQTHADWTIWASDDGSTDGTREILEAFRTTHGPDRLTILEGPRQGGIRNFMRLLADPAIRADAYAFCDQDDIWLPDKLERSLEKITPHLDRPALIGNRTIVIEEDGSERGLSPLFGRSPSFANALVQSLAGGNTMVFSQPLKELAETLGPDVGIVAHDWWLYQLATGAGGVALYDPVPNLKYRQHAGNVIGANIGIKARGARLWAALNNRFRDWNSRNAVALEKARRHFTPTNQNLLDRFVAARASGGLAGLVRFWRTGTYRQSRVETAMLALAAFLGKL